MLLVMSGEARNMIGQVSRIKIWIFQLYDSYFLAVDFLHMGMSRLPTVLDDSTLIHDAAVAGLIRSNCWIQRLFVSKPRLIITAIMQFGAHVIGELWANTTMDGRCGWLDHPGPQK